MKCLPPSLQAEIVEHQVVNLQNKEQFRPRVCKTAELWEGAVLPATTVSRTQIFTMQCYYAQLDQRLLPNK